MRVEETKRERKEVRLIRPQTESSSQFLIRCLRGCRALFGIILFDRAKVNEEMRGESAVVIAWQNIFYGTGDIRFCDDPILCLIGFCDCFAHSQSPILAL